MHALEKMKRRFPVAVRRKPYRCQQPLVYMHYGEQMALRIDLPDKLPEEVEAVVGPMRGHDLTDLRDLMRRVNRLERLDQDIVIAPDAEEYIEQRLFQERIQDLVAEIRRDPAKHPLRKTLLKTELLPYQLDGIAFAVGAGRAILADDMGLGKTIQGVGVAELLAREADIRKVLVVCPASLKSQWRNEIQRFCDRDCQLVLGGAADAPRSTTTTASSPSATTSRCCATSCPSSGSSGT